jgi:CPA1 family monovalent cation:H+ antiporter
VIAPTFLLSVFGSILAGLALAWIVGRLIPRMIDAPSSIILQFVSTYGVWMLAERLGLSPILTMVLYAMTLAHSTPAYLSAGLRIPSNAVWETAVLILRYCRRAAHVIITAVGDPQRNSRTACAALKCHISQRIY